MKRIVLGMVLLSNIIFAQPIASNVMGCYKKSDALNANIAFSLGKIGIVQEYINTDKCYAFQPSKQKIDIKILSKEYQKFLTKGKAIYIQFQVLKIDGKPFNEKFWYAMEVESYKLMPLVK